MMLIEILRRHKALQLTAVVMLVGLWYLVSDEVDAVPAAIAASLGAAFMVGPGRMPIMIPPAVSYLPLSRRDVWRATWLASTVWPAALVTTTMLLTMVVPAIRTTLGFSRVTLAAAYAFAYVGAGFVLVMLLSIAGSHPRIWRPLREVLTAIIPLATMGGFYAGVWGSRLLPTQWSELSAPGAFWLVTTIGLVTAMYFYSPRLTGNAPLRSGNRRSAAERAAARPIPPSRLTGLPRLLWNEYAWTLGVAGVIMALGGVLVMALDTFFNSHRLAAGIVRAQLVWLFDRNSATPDYGFGYMFWLIMFVLAGVARFGFIIRHLRVLPLRPLQLNAMLVVWPAGVLVPVWATLMVAYLLVVQQPVTSLGLGVLLSLIGSSALARSITMRWQPMSAALVLLVAFLGVLSGMRLSAPPAPVLGLTGTAGLIAAALLNRATLRHSAAYRRPTMAIGLPPPR